MDAKTGKELVRLAERLPDMALLNHVNIRLHSHEGAKDKLPLLAALIAACHAVLDEKERDDG